MSAVHNHYRRERVVDERGVTSVWQVCKHCILTGARAPARYAEKTSTGNLLAHLDKLHKGEPPPRSFSSSSSSAFSASSVSSASSSSSFSSSSAPSSSSSSSDSSAASESAAPLSIFSVPAAKRHKGSVGGRQTTLHDSRAVIDNAAVRPALALLFARCSWAHHAVDYPEFMEFIRVVRSSTCGLPDRQGLRNEQLALAQRLRSRVVHQLRNYCRSFPLSVAIDGWTNVNTAKVTNVVIVCGGVAYYWCSIVNSKDRNTAAWLCEPLLRVLDGIRQEGLVYSALVADNEAVNGALWARLRQPLPFLNRSPCAAHIIQLCVHKALALPVVNPILAAVESLLRQFKPKAQRTALINVQLAKLNADAAADVANSVQSTGKKEALV